MKIAYASADYALSDLDQNGHPRPGGAGWYRCRVPSDALRAVGHDAIHVGGVEGAADGSLRPVTWAGDVLDGYEVIILQRWMHPDAADRIRRARATGQVVIQDIDDYYWGLDPRNAAFAATHPRPDYLAAHVNRAELRRKGIQAPVTNPNNIRAYSESIGASSAITCSTPFLATKLAERYRVPVYLLRNAIDLQRWSEVCPQAARPTLGWVGAIPWRSGDLETLSGVLGPLVERHDLTVIHGGATKEGEFASVLGLDPARVTDVAMCSIVDYPRLFAGIDLGLVPLSDKPFNHAKSAIKGMEYAASGVPYVAADTPEYRWFGAGPVAARSRHWIAALERLLDPAVRAVSASTAHLRVAREDIAKRWVEWESVYLAVVGDAARVA